MFELPPPLTPSDAEDSAKQDQMGDSGQGNGQGSGGDSAGLLSQFTPLFPAPADGDFVGPQFDLQEQHEHDEHQNEHEHQAPSPPVFSTDVDFEYSDSVIF